MGDLSCALGMSPSWRAGRFKAEAAVYTEAGGVWKWQGSRDSNPEPTDLESVALTNWSYYPFQRAEGYPLYALLASNGWKLFRVE